MGWLLVSEFRQNQRSAIALLVFFIVAGGWTSLALGFLASISSPQGQALLAQQPEGAAQVLVQICVFMMILGILLPTLLVAVGLASLRVKLSMRTHALWALNGAAPGQILGVVLIQQALLAGAGALIGSAIGVSLQDAFNRAVVGATDIPVVLPVAWTISSIGLSVLLLGGASTLAALMPARRAAKVAPIEALALVTTAKPRQPIVRVCLAALLLLLAVVLAQSLPTQRDNSSASAIVILLGGLLVFGVALIGDIAFPVVTRGWTALIPSFVGPSWFLARASAVQRAGQLSTVAPAFVATGLITTYVSAAATWVLASRQSDSVGLTLTGQGLILFGPAAVIALVGALAALMMIDRESRAEVASFEVLGIAPATLLRRSSLEAAILAATSLTVGGVVASVPVLLYALWLQGKGYAFAFMLALGPAAALAVVLFIVTTLALGVPLMGRLRPGVAIAELARDS